MRRARLAAAIALPFLVAALPLAAWAQFRSAPDAVRVVVVRTQPAEAPTFAAEAATTWTITAPSADSVSGAGCGGTS
ncbi:MAG: hypothetical protein RMK15_09495 [Chloroflexota bacterium]|nr:hypothetical protein [Chloroflexota bacterium]